MQSVGRGGEGGARGNFFLNYIKIFVTVCKVLWFNFFYSLLHLQHPEHFLYSLPHLLIYSTSTIMGSTSTIIGSTSTIIDPLLIIHYLFTTCYLLFFTTVFIAHYIIYYSLSYLLFATPHYKHISY